MNIISVAVFLIASYLTAENMHTPIRKGLVGPLWTFETINIQEYAKISGLVQGIFGRHQLFFNSGITSEVALRYIASPYDLHAFNKKNEEPYTGTITNPDIYITFGYMPIKTDQASLQLYAGFGYERLTLQGIGAFFDFTQTIFKEGIFKYNIIYALIGYEHTIQFGNNWHVGTHFFYKPNLRQVLSAKNFNDGGARNRLKYGYGVQATASVLYSTHTRFQEYSFGIIPYIEYTRIGQTTTQLFDPSIGITVPVASKLFKLLAGGALVFAFSW